VKDLIKKILKEETEPVLMIPGPQYFGGVEGLKTYIETKNIKRWSLGDNLVLFKYEGDLTWLEGLVSISDSLDLEGTQIESLGNLQSVGGNLLLNKFLSTKYTDEEIKSMVDVGNIIHRP
jgi:hypothetical protein